MKRRTLGLMCAGSAVALAAGLGKSQRAKAAVSQTLAAELKGGTLTPMGSERAGNADGSIPEWTGGLTEVPSGWVPGTQMPDPFADDVPEFTITPSNYTQYQDKLTPGTVTLIQKYGLTLNVYKTRRTHAMPQYIYDNIYRNALNAQPAAGGSRLGYTNAYGGYPFPIPDPTNPSEAGAQIQQNHSVPWGGTHASFMQGRHSQIGGEVTLLGMGKNVTVSPFYSQDPAEASSTLWFLKLFANGTAPAENVGSEQVVHFPVNTYANPIEVWNYLTGQGRVRKLPNAQYDVPDSNSNGLQDFDENFLLSSALDRYDFKLLGKQEVYIPYNNDKMLNMTTADLLPQYLNPEVVRWELHRVWVVDVTLHPGERHVVPHRRLYYDEDTWRAMAQDEWDAQGDLWKVGYEYVMNRPDLPGLAWLGQTIYNLQQHGYLTEYGIDITSPPGQRTYDLVTVPDPTLFDPNKMAARAQF